MCCFPIGYTADGLPIYATSAMLPCTGVSIDPCTGQTFASEQIPLAQGGTAPPGAVPASGMWQGLANWFSGLWLHVKNFFSSIWDSTTATAQTVKAWIEKLINRTLKAAEWAGIWLLIVVGIVAVAAIVILMLVR